MYTKYMVLSSISKSTRPKHNIEDVAHTYSTALKVCEPASRVPVILTCSLPYMLFDLELTIDKNTIYTAARNKQLAKNHFRIFKQSCHKLSKMSKAEKTYHCETCNISHANAARHKGSKHGLQTAGLPQTLRRTYRSRIRSGKAEEWCVSPSLGDTDKRLFQQARYLSMI